MHSIQNIYTRKMCQGRLALLLFLLTCSFAVLGQNLNNPNKRGPLGTQVNTLSGNLFIPRTDIYVPARSFGLNIRFYYNSFLFTDDYGYGKGWTFEYNIRYKNDTTPGSKLILWGDGREDQYDSIPGGTYKTPRGFFNTLSQYQPGKYVLTELNGVKYFFDNATHKRITRMEEPNGNYINFTYTDTLLTVMSNTAGQSISFTYNAQGRLASVVDAMAVPSRTFTYTYDASGNLKEAKDPLNNKYQYAYLVNGPMKSLADKNNNKIDIIYFPDFTVRELIGCNKRLSFSYDTSSKTTFVTDHLTSGNQVTKYKYQTVDNLSWITSISGNCCGYNMNYEFDDQGNKIKETDANGNIYTYTYDSIGNMLTRKDPLNQVSTFTYTSDFNKVSSFTDPKGIQYTMQYDVKGNLTQLVDPGNHIYTATYDANGDIISSTDPKGNSYIYNYDAYGNPTHVNGPNGFNAILTYDARGNLLAYTDSRGNGTSVEYDILNRLKKIIDPLNNSLRFEYDAVGNIISYINKNNETTTFNYDASNRIVKATGPTGNQVAITYDAMNNITKVKDVMGHEIEYSYDNRNRIKNAKDPQSNTAIYNYDANGNVTSFSLPNGQLLNYTYDALDRIVSVSDATGTLASMNYDKNDNITSFTNGTGATTSMMYDSLNRIGQVTDPLGNSFVFSYDKNDNVISATDREGRTTLYTYDSLNRAKTYTDNNGFVVTIGYDATSNVVSLKDQNNNTTTYTYDSLNRRKRMTYPDGSFNELTYDNKGNVIAKRQTDGSIINYIYDTLNRVIARQLPDGQNFLYTYDRMGRIISATNSAGTVTFTYDALSRITSETFNGRTVNYQYSIAGRTQSIVYPDSSIVIKEYDTRNRLKKILKDSITLVEYSYNSLNQLTNKTFANGVISNMQYDFANRLSNISTANGSIQNTSFTYDKEMNKTAIIRHNNLSISEEFSYDNGYRLASYKRGVIGGTPSIQNTYNYDAVGNRATANLNGINTTYTVNNLNQLVSSNGAQNISFTYDGRGNLTYDGFFHKSYDAEGRLLKDSSSPANVIVYAYDALNRRVIKNTNGNALEYTYSGLSAIEERNAGNDLLNSTVYARFLSPLVNDRNGNRFYYHQNELNSVEVITNGNGRIAEQYRYDVYGKPSRYDSANNPMASSVAGNRFGFTGQEYDSASGSYRFFYRNYSPETGIFNQRDLIEYDDGLGMYQYVGNNPANGVDVLGLKDCQEKGRPFSWYVSGADFLEELNGRWEKQKEVWDIMKNIADDNRKIRGDWESIKENTKNYNKYKHVKPDGYHAVSNYHQTQAAGYKSAVEVSQQKLAIDQQSLVKNTNKLDAAKSTPPKATKLGMGLNLLDNGVKGYEMYKALSDGQSNPQNTQETKAVIDFGLSLAGWTPPGAIYGGFDFIMETTSGDGFTTQLESTGGFFGEAYSAWESNRPVQMQWGRPARWDEMVTAGNMYAWLFYDVPYDELQDPTDPCNDPPGGTKKRPKVNSGGIDAEMQILFTCDPNLIKGPDGQPDKAWISVNDRIPYTIYFENDSTATAPVKYLKIISPVEPKQDAATLELGSVGFNNISFDLPPGNSFYYQRLDARDSTGLYIDMTAGYDIVTNNIFWEFQAIDPATLLPPEDPMAGFVFVQDTLNPDYGKGFVNFSIKPKSNSLTLDTIGARAFIVFDQNDTIPTNIHFNTIDAFAPTSSIVDLPNTSPNTDIPISYTGIDDPNGSGVKWYSIYVSDNNGPPELFVANYALTDTIFKGVAEHLYKFYFIATDTAGNTEIMRFVDSIRITSGEYVICPDGSVSFSAGITGTAYQWQVDDGTGYVDINNGGIYSGATSPTLTLTNAPTNMYGYQYRCVIDNVQHSDIYLLKFGMSWEGTVNNAWENPANWNCNSLPDQYTDVIINGSKPNFPTVNSNVTIRTLKLNPGATGTVANGFTLTILK